MRERSLLVMRDLAAIPNTCRRTAASENFLLYDSHKATEGKIALPLIF